jgi:multidrug efflux pump subunit AcrB
VQGLTDVTIGAEHGPARGRGDGRPRPRQRSYGLRSAGVAQAVALFFRGRPLARYRGPEGEVEVEARLAEQDRSSLAQLERMPLQGTDGQNGAARRARRVPQGRNTRQHPAPAAAHGATVEGNTTASNGGEVRKSVTRELSR